MTRHEIELRPGDQAVISVPSAQPIEITPTEKEAPSLGPFRDFVRQYASQIVDYTQGRSFEDGTDLFSQTSMQELAAVVKQLQQDAVEDTTLQEQIETTLGRSLHGSLGKEDLKDVARNFSFLVQEFSTALNEAEKK